MERSTGLRERINGTELKSWRLQIALWLCLNLFDWISTVLNMFNGILSPFYFNGLGEAHPVLSQFSIPTLLLYKVGIAAIAVIILYKWNKLHLLKLLNILMGIVVVWNIFWFIIG